MTLGKRILIEHAALSPPTFMEKRVALGLE